MAKPPTVFPFSFNSNINTSFANVWRRLPDFNFSGFDGTATISRVRMKYSMVGDLSVDSNGNLAEYPFVGIAVTTGSPPSAPLPNPTSRDDTEQVKWVDCPAMSNFVNGTVGLQTVFNSEGGEIDAKAQTRIPASPGAAAVWIGLEVIDGSGAPVTRNLEFRCAGVVVRLGPL